MNKVRQLSYKKMDGEEVIMKGHYIVEPEEEEQKAIEEVAKTIFKAYGSLIITTDKNGKDLFEGDMVQGTIVSQWSKSLIRCEIVRKEYEFVCIEHRDNCDCSHKVRFAKDIELIGNKWECAE